MSNTNTNFTVTPKGTLTEAVQELRHATALDILKEFGPLTADEAERYTYLDASDILSAFNALVRTGHAKEVPEP